MEQNKIFISYSHKDRVVATKICEVLESADIKCWMAPRDINGGEDYAEAMEVAIKKCDKFLLVFSRNSAMSQYVKAEVSIAFCEGKIIIPYKIDNTELTGSLRVHLNDRHWIEGGIKQVVSAIVTTEIIASGPIINKRTTIKMVFSSIIIILSAVFISHPDFFHSKYPRVISKKKCGLIDSLNQEILQVIFDEIEPFPDGQRLTKVKIDNQYGVITNKGSVIIKPIYNSIEIVYNRFIGEYTIVNGSDKIRTLLIEDIERCDYSKEFMDVIEKPLSNDHNLMLTTDEK